MKKAADPTSKFRFDHAFGPICGQFSPRGLCSLVLPGGRHAVPPHSAPRPRVNDERVRLLLAALNRYFAGKPEPFDDIPLDFGPCTAFQERVWRALRDISWGKTETYGSLSQLLGYGTRASRAVGTAMGRNPIPLVVPCHRVLASQGLGGFGAGLAWKRELLRIEGVEV
ncbi:MAG: methylated-DNA--[protein]-cysteine S-methyltransferase [Candidatus Hydrogenedentales bacterium]|jgi:O-6-methylguanine DNA methyltransferase